MRRYALSDPHGRIDVLEQALSSIELSPDDHLYLLGDYIPHERMNDDEQDWLCRCVDSLEYVRCYQREHVGRVSVLKGNHENMLLERVAWGEVRIGRDLVKWLKSLPLYEVTEKQIFVHAGIDEEAGEWWQFGTEEHFFFEKFPPTLGSFEKDIVAGHVSTRTVSGDPEHVGVFWDGQSHYYIDAGTEASELMYVLCYDVEQGRYSQRIATCEGVGEPLPIDAPLV